jgi:hypothetical protein
MIGYIFEREVVGSGHGLFHVYLNVPQQISSCYSKLPQDTSVTSTYTSPQLTLSYCKLPQSTSVPWGTPTYIIVL